MLLSHGSRRSMVEFIGPYSCPLFEICMAYADWNISHSKKKWARCNQKCILVFIQSTGYSCQVFIKREFSWQIFKKIRMTNFMNICPLGAKLFPADRRTKGQTDMTMLIVAFRNFANACKETLCQSTIQCSCNDK